MRKIYHKVKDTREERGWRQETILCSDWDTLKSRYNDLNVQRVTHIDNDEEKVMYIANLTGEKRQKRPESDKNHIITEF